jgi:hypothetical protein
MAMKDKSIELYVACEVSLKQKFGAQRLKLQSTLRQGTAIAPQGPYFADAKALIFWRVKTQVYIEIWCANGETSSIAEYPTYDDAPGVIRSLPTTTVIIMIIRYYIDANYVAIPHGKQMRAHEIKETFIQIGVETLSPLSLCDGLEALNPDSFCSWKKRKA